MTGPRAHIVSLRSRLIVCLAAGVLSLLFGAYEARGASAVTTATNCEGLTSYSGTPAPKTGCTNPPPATAPVVEVLPEKVISGTARPHGPAECVAASPVFVTGTRIASATFYLDGHKVKTVVRADKKGRYGIEVNARKLKFGAHRVKVVVAFEAKSRTATKTFNVLVFRCKPSEPRFTG